MQPEGRHPIPVSFRVPPDLPSRVERDSPSRHSQYRFPAAREAGPDVEGQKKAWGLGRDVGPQAHGEESRGGGPSLARPFSFTPADEKSKPWDRDRLVDVQPVHPPLINRNQTVQNEVNCQVDANRILHSIRYAGKILPLSLRETPIARYHGTSTANLEEHHTMPTTAPTWAASTSRKQPATPTARIPRTSRPQSASSSALHKNSTSPPATTTRRKAGISSTG